MALARVIAERVLARQPVGHVYVDVRASRKRRQRLAFAVDELEGTDVDSLDGLSRHADIHVRRIHGSLLMTFRNRVRGMRNVFVIPRKREFRGVWPKTLGPRPRLKHSGAGSSRGRRLCVDLSRSLRPARAIAPPPGCDRARAGTARRRSRY